VSRASGAAAVIDDLRLRLGCDSNFNQGPKMTNDMMNLRSLMEKSQETDFSRAR
jgi:hypothetical protein